MTIRTIVIAYTAEDASVAEATIAAYKRLNYEVVRLLLPTVATAAWTETSSSVIGRSDALIVLTSNADGIDAQVLTELSKIAAKAEKPAAVQMPRGMEVKASQQPTISMSVEGQLELQAILEHIAVPTESELRIEQQLPNHNSIAKSAKKNSRAGNE